MIYQIPSVVLVERFIQSTDGNLNNRYFLGIPSNFYFLETKVNRSVCMYHVKGEVFLEHDASVTLLRYAQTNVVFYYNNIFE